MIKRIIFLLSQTSEHLCSKRLNECKVKNEMLTEREKNVNRDAAKCACVKEGCMSWFGWNMSLIYLLYSLTHRLSTCIDLSGHGEAFCPDDSRFMANVSWEQFEDLNRTP